MRSELQNTRKEIVATLQNNSISIRLRAALEVRLMHVNRELYGNKN